MASLTKIYGTQVVYGEVEPPVFDFPDTPVELTDKTMEERRDKVLKAMAREGYDILVIYADREHGHNFCYLTGFVPRFEEAVIVLHSDGTACLLLGNESLPMGRYSRLRGQVIHVPYFSLPNQPMENPCSFRELFEKAGIKKGSRVEIIGWKMFTSGFEDNRQLFDVPEFIVGTVKALVGSGGEVVNACDLMISPAYGVRTLVNANEIAYYEFGASLASGGVMKAMNQVKVGVTEMELASNLEHYGALNTVQTICATGERYTNGVVEPRKKPVRLGDRFSLTVGYYGGLTSRKGYAAGTEEDLPEEERGYIEKVAKPYYGAAATWYSNIGLGVTGGQLYDCIEEVVPKDKYHWSLNPGHLIGTEEWMSSPVYQGSGIPLKSGMMLQMDIIINVEGFGGANAEDGIAIADENLQRELERDYPEVFKRMQRRRDYMERELGIRLKDEILPLSDTEGYFRPFLLNQKRALKVGKGCGHEGLL